VDVGPGHDAVAQHAGVLDLALHLVARLEGERRWRGGAVRLPAALPAPSVELIVLRPAR
jgi:hypothetical protein